jgi:hypothetical protein
MDDPAGSVGEGGRTQPVPVSVTVCIFGVELLWNEQALSEGRSPGVL